ncbi:hypothetical protein [Solimonas terrae]|uniref:Esterase-like activity of phytase family protein n=1 Tax=Solimonas terrae TaxID=1396819 RepID=A0A6M2BRY2_9GAMM|nr:hypothetical protein [Solimonas terrae]NGY05090.1 hypothetical protein [Solimonas terrae]
MTTMTAWRFRRGCALLLLAGLPSVRAAVPAAVTDTRLPELSGCSRSRLDPQRLWVHNDSGNPAQLYAIDLRGQVRQTVAVAGAEARDWEDIASFRWHGMPYLALADTGDNFAWRDDVAVLLLQEPAAGARRATPLRTIRFRYPDGAHDVESLAVDPVSDDILLLEKRRPPARLYRLALDGPERQQAEPIAVLPDWWPEPPTPVETLGAQHYRGAVAAMDLSDDGLHLAMLTSTHWMVFTRTVSESWASALARAPQIARLPEPAARGDTLFEALCWAADGGLWISGERLPAPLLHLDPESPR